jgi:hypothetical protein
LWADLIIDQQTEPQYVQLVDYICSPETTFSAFSDLDSDLSREPFKTYFEFIFNTIRSASDADGSGPDVAKSNTVDIHPDGASGNKGNPGSNGTSGKGSGK